MTTEGDAKKPPLAAIVALGVLAVAVACVFVLGGFSVLAMALVVLSGMGAFGFAVVASLFRPEEEQSLPLLLVWLGRLQIVLSLIVLALGRGGQGVALAGVVLLVGGWAVRFLTRLPAVKREEVFASSTSANIAGLASAAMMIVVLYAYADEAFRIPTGSMEPTLYGDPVMGDRAIVNKLAYVLGTPARGDIAIFRFPLSRSQPYVKRIVGLPGERVIVADGDVYLQKSRASLPEVWRKEGRVREAMWLELLRFEGGYGTYFKGLRGQASEVGDAIKLGPQSGFRYPREGSLTNHNPTSDASADQNYNHEHVKDVRISATVGKGVVIKLYRDEGVLTLDVHGRTLTIGDRVHQLTDFKGYDHLALRFAVVDGQAVVEVGGREILRVDFETSVAKHLNALHAAGKLDATLTALVESAHVADFQLEASGGAYLEIANLSDAPSSVGNLLIERDIHYGGRRMIEPDGRTSGGPTLPWAADAGEEGYIMLGDNSENSLDSRAWFEVEYQILGEDPVRGQLQDLSPFIGRTREGVGALVQALNTMAGSARPPADPAQAADALFAAIKAGSAGSVIAFNDIYGIPRRYDISEIRSLSLRRVAAVPANLIDGQLSGSVFPVPRFVD